MADSKGTCLRFNLNKPEQKKTWDILQKSSKSHSKLIVEALIEYDERHSKLTDDPYFETREREDRFAEQIVSAVENTLEKSLPTFFSAMLLNMAQPYSVPAVTVPEKLTETSADSIDWDFLSN